MAGKLVNIRFKKAEAVVLSIHHISRILVEWELEQTTQNLKDLKFFIDRGESPQTLAPISKSAGIPANTPYEFLDISPKMIDLEKVYYYQVRGVEYFNGTPVQTFFSPVFTWFGALDLVGLYIVEEHLFAHQYVYGSPVFVYKKKKEGDTCDDCYDKVLKRLIDSRCQRCLGTGWIGGYYDPVAAWLDFNPDPKIVQIAEWGERQPSQTDCQFTNYPIISPGDLVFELVGNRIWRVINSRFTEKNRTTMLQIMRLDEVNRSDVEYRIPVPEDVRTSMLEEFRQRGKIPEF